MEESRETKIPITVHVDLSEGWAGERWDVVDVIDEREGLSLGDIGVSDFSAFSNFPELLERAVLNTLSECEDFKENIFYTLTLSILDGGSEIGSAASSFWGHEVEAAMLAAESEEFAAVLKEITDSFKDGNYDTMLQAAKFAVDLKPESAEAHYHLGNAYGLLKRHEESEKELMRAIILDANHDGAFYALGLSCLDRDRFEDAIKYLKESIRLNSNDAMVHFYLGEAYELLADTRTSRGESHQRNDIPDSTGTMKMIEAFAQDLNRYSDAKKCYEEAVKIRPGYAMAHYGLARIKAYEFGQLPFRDELDDAIASYKMAVGLDSDLTDAQSELEWLLVLKSKMVGPGPSK